MMTRRTSQKGYNLVKSKKKLDIGILTLLKGGRGNIAAIKAYKSVAIIREGSEYTFKDNDKSLTMIWHV